MTSPEKGRCCEKFSQISAGINCCIRECDCHTNPISNDGWVSEKVLEFNRYQNDTDWQEMNGPELVDVNDEKWLRAALLEAEKRGRDSKN